MHELLCRRDGEILRWGKAVTPQPVVLRAAREVESAAVNLLVLGTGLNAPHDRSFKEGVPGDLS
ncbi:hypothetical protein ACFTZI_00300 [Streptomyces decoyicus]|uniref:hypothetical protein n=1 Tax=Streptomyces decoyicus TaxID=249567 RepID=UPI00362D5F5C